MSCYLGPGHSTPIPLPSPMFSGIPDVGNQYYLSAELLNRHQISKSREPTNPSRYRPSPDISDRFELTRAPIPTLSKSVWSQSRGGTVPMPSLPPPDRRFPV